MQALELLDTAVLSMDLKARCPAAQLCFATLLLASSAQNGMQVSGYEHFQYLRREKRKRWAARWLRRMTQPSCWTRR